MRKLRKTLHEDALCSMSPSYLDTLCHKYNNDPSSVKSCWEEFFLYEDSLSHIDQSKKTSCIKNTTQTNQGNIKHTFDNIEFNNLKAMHLIEAYRKFGHIASSCNPIKNKLLARDNEFLNPSTYYLNDNDPINLPSLFPNAHDVSRLVQHLDRIYCGNICVEFSYIANVEQKKYMEDLLEKANLLLDDNTRIEAYKQLLRVSSFENFIHTKKTGAKRFSIEGTETFITSMWQIIEHASGANIDNVLIGMAHRGRLAALCEILKTPYAEIFAEFTGCKTLPPGILGDVKYHLGTSKIISTQFGNVNASILNNPSHLESVNSVLQGRVRALQDSNQNTLGIIVHGDSAMSAQGSVYESMSISGTTGYNTCGNIHIVIDNQIGFTANPSESRGYPYPDFIAKAMDIPIFRVNADDVDSVIIATQKALRFRDKFKKDVVISLIGYRRYGHNEGDEPRFTQPLMYAQIDSHTSVTELYEAKLQSENLISADLCNSERKAVLDVLEHYLAHPELNTQKYTSFFTDNWEGFQIATKYQDPISTNVDTNSLKALAEATQIPQNIQINRKLKKILDARYSSIQNEESLDWGTGEMLAFGSILLDGYHIRISGQDACRGTFSHRHAVVLDENTEESFIPLQHLHTTFDKQIIGTFSIYNSPLSEYAVLGFEYGYSLHSPYNLVVWEAQFGDFANGAQIIIDQFIVSAEAKWGQSSGIVLLLPHGYEGQGPEHSSARIERFLQLSAENNIYIVNCSTPANFFHALRRQVLNTKHRKPLCVFSPKSLLRHKLAKSKLSDFSGCFLEIIPECDVLSNTIARVILCSGKVFYDLLQMRRNNSINTIAIIRVEQIAPLCIDKLSKILKTYKEAEVIWCQEEPKNMGSWTFIYANLNDTLHIKYCGRPISASPASGYMQISNAEQEALLKSALCIKN